MTQTETEKLWDKIPQNVKEKYLMRLSKNNNKIFVKATDTFIGIPDVEHVYVDDCTTTIEARVVSVTVWNNVYYVHVTVYPKEVI